MKPTPFDPVTDLAPIPFSRELCQLAAQLKQDGLIWHPHVGCFVWDKDKHIPVSSPFPHRIYFILNMGHFLKIFESTSKMVEQLVWLPTWHQARLICEQLSIASKEINEKLLAKSQNGDNLVILYQIILEKLKKRNATHK